MPISTPNGGGTLRLRVYTTNSALPISYDQLDLRRCRQLADAGHEREAGAGFAYSFGQLQAAPTWCCINCTAGTFTTTFERADLDFTTGTIGGAQIKYLTGIGGSVLASQNINDGSAAVPATFSGGAVVVLRLSGAVTPVTIDAFSVRRDGAGMLLDWHAASEFQNLGFNVYRRSVGTDDVWNRVNAALRSETAYHQS